MPQQLMPSMSITISPPLIPLAPTTNTADLVHNTLWHFNYIKLSLLLIFIRLRWSTLVVVFDQFGDTNGTWGVNGLWWWNRTYLNLSQRTHLECLSKATKGSISNCGYEYVKGECRATFSWWFIKTPGHLVEVLGEKIPIEVWIVLNCFGFPLFAR